MNKELKAFRKICQNLNSYEFTDEFKKNKKLIETTLKNYVELTSKPFILLGRTHGEAQALIDYICKNYKEVKITNLVDEKKLKALEIIKEKMVYIEVIKYALKNNYDCGYYNMTMDKLTERYLTEQEYDLLKEVLL